MDCWFNIPNFTGDIFDLENGLSYQPYPEYRYYKLGIEQNVLELMMNGVGLKNVEAYLMGKLDAS